MLLRQNCSLAAVLLPFFLLTACGVPVPDAATKSTVTNVAQTKSQPKNFDSSKKLGGFKLAVSLIAVEQQEHRDQGYPVYDLQGNTIIKVSSKFLNELRTAGQGMVLPGRSDLGRFLKFTGVFDRTVSVRDEDGNFVDAVKKTPAFELAGSFSKEGLAVVPDFALGVNANEIPAGSKIYIPAFRGLKLMDSSEHTGVFNTYPQRGLARSSIELLVSFQTNERTLKAAGIKSGRVVDLYLVEPTRHSTDLE